MVQFTFPGGRLNVKATTFKFLLEWAYGILPAQHSDGPSWIENDRYDIAAKAGGNATDAEMKRMTQALLVERFKLKFHTESREVPVLVVSLGKSAPKLGEPKEEEKHSLKIVPQMDSEQKIMTYHVVATRFSIAQLNETFARQLGRVIVDQTGLQGDYDFALDLTPDENHNPLDPSLIMNAMRDQLGFTVKSLKSSVEFLVIENVEKVVAGN